MVYLPSKSSLCGPDSAAPSLALRRQEYTKVCSSGRATQTRLSQNYRGKRFFEPPVPRRLEIPHENEFPNEFRSVTKEKLRSEQELYVDWRRSKFSNPRAPRFVNFEPRSSESALCILIIAWTEVAGGRACFLVPLCCVLCGAAASGSWRRWWSCHESFSVQIASLRHTDAAHTCGLECRGEGNDK